MREWISKLIRTDCPEDPKRLLLLLSGCALIIGFLSLAIPAGIHIHKYGDIGSGAVGALICTAGPLAGLAGYAHKKPDDPSPSQE